MRIGEILKAQQPKEHKKLNKNRNQNKKKRKRGNSKEDLSFSDVMELMKHDSYYRGKGGAIRQK